MQLSHSLPAESFQMPSLLKLAQMFTSRAQVSVPRKASGLSLFDIDDASLRATATNGLTVRPNPNQAMRSL